MAEVKRDLVVDVLLEVKECRDGSVERLKARSGPKRRYGLIAVERQPLMVVVRSQRMRVVRPRYHQLIVVVRAQWRRVV